jgi:hypothetical protein
MSSPLTFDDADGVSRHWVRNERGRRAVFGETAIHCLNPHFPLFNYTFIMKYNVPSHYRY